MTGMQYIREEDKEEYREFCMRHLPLLTLPVVPEVWHYTTADGLIGILKSGQIWSTEISCLNDSLEHKYFISLIHEGVKIRRAQNTDANLAILWRVADEKLEEPDYATAEHFVACFSEVEDDLTQWRGYGGGECGYAIGFQFDGLLEAISARPGGAVLVRMNYEDTRYMFIVNEILRMAQVYFLQGLQRGFPDIERWAREFLLAFAMEVDVLAMVMKHPKFCAEAERRVTTRLQVGEHTVLEFRQKRTLLARHLPIDLRVLADGSQRLPITSIYVGPGSSQQVTRISVGDLLLKFGYQNIPVIASKVPYRVP